MSLIEVIPAALAFPEKEEDAKPKINANSTKNPKPADVNLSRLKNEWVLSAIFDRLEGLIDPNKPNQHTEPGFWDNQCLLPRVLFL
jgi:hypothetical protein